MIRQIFNEVMMQENCTSETWRRIRIKVIYKKRKCGRGQKLPFDLYSFSDGQTVLNTYLQQTLYQTWPYATGGPGRVSTFASNAGSSCNIQTAWVEVTGVGYQNVVRDEGPHEDIWLNKSQCGIEPQYMSLLRRLYTERKVTVLTDRKTDVFEIKRGTEQDDPLFSLLFNTVLQMTLNDDVTRWQKIKDMEIYFDDSESDCLTNQILQTTYNCSLRHWSRSKKWCSTSSRVPRG